MVSKFIINGKVLEDLIIPQSEKDKFTPIYGILSFDGKTLRFLNCKTMEVRATERVKPLNKEKALFKSKEFRAVSGLGSREFLVVIKGDVIEIYNLMEKDRVIVEIKGADLL
jgi:hypothetical protein